MVKEYGMIPNGVACQSPNNGDWLTQGGAPQVMFVGL